MVICGVRLSPKVFGELRSERVRDSKKIGPNRREDLDKFLKKKVEKYEIIEIEATEIDELRENGTNINEIEAIGFARVINRLGVSKIYIDSASANSEKFAKEIEGLLENTTELIVEHEADDRYLPVSAASIIAKVRRDERIIELQEEYGETGSGYPSDERTIKFLRKWLKDHKTLPQFARRSWKTVSRLRTEIES